MHANNLISDFRQTTPATIKAATFVSKEPMCPFPPFFSLSASVPSTFEDDESDQGYSDPEEDPVSPGAQYRGPAPNESPPLSPEEYNPAASPMTPLRPHIPSRLQAYNNNPHGGWGPPANWHGQPSTPLSEIMPNPDPWPYPQERYISPVPTGALPFSATPSTVSPESLSPPIPSPLPPQPSYILTTPEPRPQSPDGKILFYPQPIMPRPPPRIPCRSLLEQISSPPTSLQPTQQPMPLNAIS
jgi:hypothetical protein